MGDDCTAWTASGLGVSSSRFKAVSCEACSDHIAISRLCGCHAHLQPVVWPQVDARVVDAGPRRVVAKVLQQVNSWTWGLEIGQGQGQGLGLSRGPGRG